MVLRCMGESCFRVLLNYINYNSSLAYYTFYIALKIIFIFYEFDENLMLIIILLIGMMQLLLVILMIYFLEIQPSKDYLR
jgi:hypothetical protein